MSKWVRGHVTGRRDWGPGLFSLEVEAPEVTFEAGQFARLALPAPPGSVEEMIGRPYSFVNPPGASPHEFYVIVVPEGPLSPRLAALQPGEALWLLGQANGFFTLFEVPDADVLWCIATGTGLAPFLSMLRTPQLWQKFGRCVLVHAVRHAVELTYTEVIRSIGAAHRGAFAYVPFVSREEVPGTLHGRIPAAIDDGRLEAGAGTALAPENSHVMLCGNPEMIADAKKALGARGMRRHRRREPGHITSEEYW